MSDESVRRELIEALRRKAENTGETTGNDLLTRAADALTGSPQPITQSEIEHEADYRYGKPPQSRGGWVERDRFIEGAEWASRWRNVLLPAPPTTPPRVACNCRQPL